MFVDNFMHYCHQICIIYSSDIYKKHLNQNMKYTFAYSLWNTLASGMRATESYTFPLRGSSM